jgi:hypothetical protein
MTREDRLRDAKDTLQEARRLLEESKRSKEMGNNSGMRNIANSQQRGMQAQQNQQQRAILGGQLPLGDGAFGADSLPGPDVTYTPPLQIQNPMVNLGCLSSAQITDIVPVNINWPSSQTPASFSTGAEGPLYANRDGGNFNGRDQTGPLGDGNISDGSNGAPGQPSTGNTRGQVQGGGSFSNFNVSNSLNNGTSTPFQSAVYLTSDVQLYNISATAAGYGNITLSQEGVLWTLWPLTKSSTGDSGQVSGTYFDDFIFGTAKSSRYPIGQMGFFTNNILQGCTPFGAVNTNSGWNPGASFGGAQSQAGLNPYSPGILPGVEGLNQALLITTEQEVAVTVVKVAEEVARIFNPAAGIAASERYIYVGYDAWAVVMTTANPIGPMAAQTYITPQTVTGSVVGNNFQVILPPNFPETVYYKNQRRVVPVDTDVGLFAGTAFTAAGTGQGPR